MFRRLREALSALSSTPSNDPAAPVGHDGEEGLMAIEAGMIEQLEQDGHERY